MGVSSKVVGACSARDARFKQPVQKGEYIDEALLQRKTWNKKDKMKLLKMVEKHKTSQLLKF